MAVFWLHEHLTRRRIVGIALAVAGVALIVARGPADAAARDPLLGNVLAFASVVCWGTYTILAKRMANADPIALTATISLIGTVMLVPAVVIENASTGPKFFQLRARGWNAATGFARDEQLFHFAKM